MAYAVIFPSHARINPQLSTPTAVVVIFYSRVFHAPLNLNIFSQKHIFASYACTRELHESFKTFSIITTKNTLIVMINTFLRECSTNLALLTLRPKPHFCDLCLYKRTFYESFKSFSVITAKHETDNWVDSTVRVRHINGDFIVYPETTR